MNYTVLIVENKQEANQKIAEELFASGYHIRLANSSETVDEELKKQTPDLLLIDSCSITQQELGALLKKGQKNVVPVLVITNKESQEKVLRLLGVKKEAYITSPFEINDLIKQICNLVGHQSSNTLNNQNQFSGTRIGDLVVNIEKMLVKKETVEIELTTTEFNILKYLMQHPNQVVTKERIYRSIWQEDYHEGENSINVHICNLKKKIETFPSKPQYIKTVWGKGYMLEWS
ncbi:response regulator transcription factor [Carnobacterium sp. FSL E2-0243]|uniref:response regulator transcription factor n=1 Tax=Carnobacterium sp. FSL E2-0243 TaxID=2921365 RepID=UPI0030FD17DE